MLIELTVIALVAAYLALLALGHVLLVAAVCKGLREHHMRERGSRMASWHPRVIDGAKARTERREAELVQNAIGRGQRIAP